MLDSRAIKQLLQVSLEAQNPNGFAKAVALPPISATKQGKEPPSHGSQSLTVADVDYGGLITSLLDACAAAESVSLFFVHLPILVLCCWTERH
jgi:hypothetical protein